MKEDKKKSVSKDKSSPSILPDAELEVLACLWKMEQATAKQIRENMQDYRPMSQGAMVTLLTRLESKGWVKREKSGQGKAFLYSPAQQPASTYRQLVKKMLHRIFGGDGLTFVSTLFDAQPPTPQQIEQLQELLNNLKNDQNEGKSR